MSTVAFNWLEDESARDLRRWALAGAVVVGVHLTVISAFLYTHPSEEIGDSSSIVTIDLAPSEDIIDQPEVAPQPEVEQKPETPPPPEETETMVAPEEKPPEKIEQQKPPPPPPPMPARSKGGTQNPVAPSWETGLMKHLQQYKRYPAGAQERGEEGIALLSFSVDRTGHVLEHRVVQSSGHPDLDAEVSAMIERAQPLPPFPPSMLQPKLNLTVPIRFSLR
jgi:periplasmic protein TonB